MGLTPSLNTLDVLAASEVIPVLFEPPLLTLGPAGLPTLWLVTELLVVTVSPIREEQLATVDANTLLVPLVHWPQTKSEQNKREENPTGTTRCLKKEEDFEI